MTSVVVDDALVWPERCGEVCFLRLRVVRSSDDESSSKWYWLPNPALERGNEFAALGRMRSRRGANADFRIVDCASTSDGGLRTTVAVSVSSDSRDPLFYPTFSLRRGDDGSPILPLFDPAVGDVLVLPGETRTRELASSLRFDRNARRTVVVATMDSWNGRVVERSVECFFGEEEEEATARSFELPSDDPFESTR